MMTPGADTTDATAGPDAGPLVGSIIDLVPSSMVAGGDAIGRGDDGRVVFVRGALVAESVRARITEVRKGFARGEVVEILDGSPDRVEPPCPMVARGCGGCDLQHVRTSAQAPLKVAIVVDALRRLGGIGDPPVVAGEPAPAEGFRTTVRAAVIDGRAAYRRHHSHDSVVPESCLVAHPLLADLLVGGDFAEASEVTLRVAPSTGERLALVDPATDGVVLPGDVLVVGTRALKKGRRAWIHDEVAGRRWRISARSFFQSHSDGAATLVDAVARALGDDLAGARLVDAYAGVGLFAGCLTAGDLPPGIGRPGPVVVVERSASSVADARHNLDDLAARVIKSDIETWRSSAADVVVADPSRAGLGRRAAEVLASTGAHVVALISCDAASLGRDAALFAELGFRLATAEVVDLFPHTHHVEVVSRFER